ncbi:MAG: glutamate-5-semialdehyde dehydrogenase [Paraglaciecola sp.]|jgi:glutamate-5-semialdehyde dehydrogenase
MTIQQKNSILQTLALLLDQHRIHLLAANQCDVDLYQGDDQALFDRLLINEKKIDGMIQSIKAVAAKPDPVHIEKYCFTHHNGMRIINQTAPFGTILIIYESRPDVTVEAAILAFKAGSKIILKGGKEARHSNLLLIDLWHQALQQHHLSNDWVQYLDMPRAEVQAFLKNPPLPIDLIVPRGGERLISFVKAHAKCPVLVSGRGNNFVFVHAVADTKMADTIIISSKTSKISACNALDKVLIDENLPDLVVYLKKLIAQLKAAKVEIIVDEKVNQYLTKKLPEVTNETIWYEEFLAMKIVIGLVENTEVAIQKINQYAGGHSASIISTDEKVALEFMQKVDVAAVYHNASTRFTDGGEFGMGAELAISTDKLHQRGPLGLAHLVSNKWFIFGNGQIRA